MPQQATKNTPNTQTREIETLTVRGHFTPESVNVENRTVDLVWGTDEPAIMRTWFDGNYIEQLSFDKRHVDLSRLQNGAPLLDTHSLFELSDVIGVVDRASTDGKQGTATVRFSNRAAVDPIWQDVQDGILRNISVGYTVQKYEVTEPDKRGGLPYKKAIAWQPAEISLCPIGKDPNCQIRSEEITMTIPVETPLATEETTETRAVDPSLETKAETIPTTPPAAEITDVEFSTRLAQIETQKKARELTIRSYCKAAKVSEGYTDIVLASGMSEREAADKILSDLSSNQTAIRSTNTVQVTRAEGDHLIGSLVDALSFRSGGAGELPQEARQYREFSLLDCTRSILQQRGIATQDMSKSELVTRAIAVSDYAILFTSLVGRRLIPAYAEEPQTWRQFATQRTLPDFRPVSDVDVSARILPEPLTELGEYRESSFVTADGSWKIGTFAKKMVFSRQAIINDDLNALSRMSGLLGAGFSIFESNFMWNLVTQNLAGTAQGVGALAVGAKPIFDQLAPLFDASHGNIATGAITVAGIGAARLAMRQQTDIAGNHVNVVPSTILIPMELETQAEVFFGNIFPTTIGTVNPFAGSGRLNVVVEPRLSASSAVQYYIMSTAVPLFIYGQLQGSSGVQITQIQTRDPDGLTILAREDFGGALENYRGIVRVSGT